MKKETKLFFKIVIPGVGLAIGFFAYFYLFFKICEILLNP